MESRTETMKWKNAGRLPVEILFLGGFLAGTILPELAWKMEWKQKTLASFYLISSFREKEIAGWEYFFQVLQRRGVFFALLFFCGFTVFGVPLSVIYMLFLGAEIGILLSLPIQEFGLYGGIAGAGLLLPQCLLYIPVYFGFAGAVYRQSFEIWKNHGLLPAKNMRYIQQAGAFFLVYLAGIFGESFLNPWIVEKVVQSLKFF